MNDLDTLVEFLLMPVESAQPVFDKFRQLPGADFRSGGEQQRFLYVPGSRHDKVLLVAHADTAWNGGQPCSRTILDHGGVLSEKGGRLGADDRAGCAILWFLKDFGHSLLVTDGEEQGAVGSQWLMDANLDIAAAINEEHQFAVEFDRRNAKDFKCYFVGTDEFRIYIQDCTDYSEPDRFSFTDIVTLCRGIPGVNLSIGYRDEHFASEHLVLEDWQRTLDCCRSWLSGSMPRFRLPALPEQTEFPWAEWNPSNPSIQHQKRKTIIQ